MELLQKFLTYYLMLFEKSSKPLKTFAPSAAVAVCHSSGSGKNLIDKFLISCYESVPMDQRPISQKVLREFKEFFEKKPQILTLIARYYDFDVVI